MRRRVVNALAAPVVALVMAVVVSSLALLVAGYSPTKAFSVMWNVMHSTESLVIVINKAVPFYVAGVAVAIGFKMGLFNIGASGQYRLTEAAQIIYDAVWADPSDPSKTYRNAANAILSDLRKRSGITAVLGPFQPLAH